MARTRGAHGQSSVRLRRAAAVVVLALLFGACGEDSPPGPRVRVSILSIDGPLPAGMQARAVDRPYATETYALVPVPGGEAGEFVLPGAPGGSYRIEAPGGWASLQAGRMPPRLEAGRPPALLQLGHPHTVYILPAAANVRAGRTWGAWRVASDGGEPTPVALEVLREPPGYVVALRIPRDDWHGDLEIAGDVLQSVPGNEDAAAERGPLAQPYRFQARPDMHPVVIALQIAPTAPLAVALVPTGSAPRADGTPARVEVVGLPAHIEHEAEVLGGTVRFPRIPSVDRALHLQIGSDASRVRIESELWRRSPSLYVLDAPAAECRTVQVELSEPLDVIQAVARTTRGEAFGLVPFEARGTKGTLRLPPDVEEVFLDARNTWAHLDAAALRAEVPVAVFAQGFRYQGTVSGEARGATVRLFRQVGDRAYSGQGFEMPLRQEGVFGGQFPLGRYFVEVSSPRGVRRRERVLVVEEPQQFDVRLDAP